jgi:hypothetical protein
VLTATRIFGEIGAVFAAWRALRRALARAGFGSVITALVSDTYTSGSPAPDEAL